MHVHIHVADDVLYDFIKLTGTPVQRCLNAGAALELMAATAPGQSLAFTRPLFTLSMRAYEMNKNLVQLMYKYKKHETYTRCSFNANSE